MPFSKDSVCFLNAVGQLLKLFPTEILGGNLEYHLLFPVHPDDFPVRYDGLHSLDGGGISAAVHGQDGFRGLLHLRLILIPVQKEAFSPMYSFSLFQSFSVGNLQSNGANFPVRTASPL